MGAVLTPTSGHTLFSSSKTKSSQHVELRVSLGSGRSHSCGCSVRGIPTPWLSVFLSTLFSGGMPQLYASSPSLFPVPFQLSPSLLYIPPQTVSACLVLMPFLLFARLISLCLHIFPSFVSPGFLLILPFSHCYMQVRSTDCMVAVSICDTDTICTWYC